VHTTLDPVLQRAARMAVERGLRDLDTRHGYRGPFVAPGQRRPRGSGNVARAERAPRDHRLLPGRVYLGTVERAEDPDPARREQGGLVVRVGRSTGRVPWSTAARYAQSLTPTQFAPAGATVRVSVDQLITPEAPGSMRLELGPQASLVAIDPGTREVLAMVGGYDALPGMFNRATRAQRQPGSAFKPFVYSYALASRRFTLASAIDPNPGCFGTGRTAWCPAEAHAHRDGLEPAMRLREALAQSRNMVAARVIEALGPEAVGTHARALGITSPLPTDLSLALGTGSVTPAELTNAYATWASGGHYQDWMIIRRVVDPNGRDVPLPARAPVREAVSPAEAWLVTSALTSVIDRGTARSARSLNRPAAGKTGTTNRNIDAWFVGYTPDLVTGVWVGFDDRAPLGNGEEGSRAALPVWTAFMREYVRARRPPSLEFRRPEGVNVVRVDPATGLLPPGDGGVPGFATPMEEYFLAGTEPHEAAPVDAGPPVDVISADAPPSEAPGLVLPIENPVAPAAESDGGDPPTPDAAVAADATAEPSAP
jgi:penicillin-binding protein 1A